MGMLFPGAGQQFQAQMGSAGQFVDPTGGIMGLLGLGGLGFGGGMGGMGGKAPNMGFMDPGKQMGSGGK